MKRKILFTVGTLFYDVWDCSSKELCIIYDVKGETCFFYNFERSRYFSLGFASLLKDIEINTIEVLVTM